ncbi:hypothetical protein [Lysinibacillus fusiformis]|uniref:hypothetical protein n=1 Tax=Lysinibacillus fusiformis TaxID=28031 RepID=UPI00046A44E7|nr:hypothetical protein [Lysinibacillus fusiformis]
MGMKHDILEIPSSTGYWLVRADGGKFYEDFFLNNFIAISDNEITLSMIMECDFESLAGNVIEHYKRLYSETFKKDWSSQQIAHAAGRTQKFIDEMNIGDLILVPSKKSITFLIGVVTSEVYEITEEEVTSKIEVNYSINPYLKRRKVTWLKEVSRNEISEKLYWILSAHQTIFNLSEQRDYINQLLAPVYVQDNLCHGTLKISKEEGLDTDEWYELYSIIKQQSDNMNDRMIVKSNVQSPGLLELVSNNPITVISTIIVLSGAVMGEIKIGGIRLPGIIPFFQTYRKEQIEIKKSKKDLDMKDEEQRAKQLENQRAELELEQMKDDLALKKLENEAERLKVQLQISSFDAGRVFEGQTQMDSGDVQGEDESGQ